MCFWYARILGIGFLFSRNIGFLEQCGRGRYEEDLYVVGAGLRTTIYPTSELGSLLRTMRLEQVEPWHSFLSPPP